MDSPPTIEVGGVTFEMRPMQFNPVDPANIALMKPPVAVARYQELAEEFSGAGIFEVGVFRGGSTAFFSKLLNPRKLVAVDLADTPARQLEAFLAKHDADGRIEVHWGTDQADRDRMGELAEQHFGGGGIDLVVDDASHLVAPSTVTFESLFPRVRPGGLYVIEDWSHDHVLEQRMQAHIDANPDSAAVEQFRQTGDQPVETPLSVLICQIVVIAAGRPDLITDIRINNQHCEVRRGPGEMAPDTPIGDYLGVRGRRIFDDVDQRMNG